MWVQIFGAVDDLIEFLGDVWLTGNWLARRLITGVVIFSLLVLGFGMIGIPLLTVVATIVFAVATLLIFTWWGQPLVAALPATTAEGRNVLRAGVTLFALQLAMGTYLALVLWRPNGTARVLALVAVFIMTTAIFFRVGLIDPGTKIARLLLWGAAAILTVLIFVWGLAPRVMPALQERWDQREAQTATDIRAGRSLREALFPPKDRWEVSFNHHVEVDLDPTEWSETVYLPAEKLRFSGAKFLGARVRESNSGSWTEWSREDFFRNAREHLATKGFPGQIQLRGNGRAKIFVRE